MVKYLVMYSRIPLIGEGCPIACFIVWNRLLIVPQLTLRRPEGFSDACVIETDSSALRE